MQKKSDLVRIVSNEEGVSIDFTGKKNGRGAYVCKKPECILLLSKKHGLDRAFKSHVSQDVYDQILKELENIHG